MTTSPLRHWLEIIAPTLLCPTAPEGYKTLPCPKCGVSCGLRFGRHSKLWFFSHPFSYLPFPPDGFCLNSFRLWSGETMEDAEKEFEAQK